LFRDPLPKEERGWFSFFSSFKGVQEEREREREILQSIVKEKAFNFLSSSLFSPSYRDYALFWSALTLD